jgi:preprotein translocase subunit SecE
MEQITKFLKEVRVELSKVSWPTREQVTKYTMVVVGLSLALAIFLGVIDAGLVSLLNKLVLN